MIITAKRLITGDGKTVIDHGALLIKGDSIADVGIITDLKALYPEEPVVDYGDAAMLPGLIDMHVHVGHWFNRSNPELYDNYLVGFMALDYVQRALQSGVTTLRDVSSPHGVCQSLLNAAQKGFVKIPRLRSYSILMSQTY